MMETYLTRVATLMKSIVAAFPDEAEATHVAVLDAIVRHAHHGDPPGEELVRKYLRSHVKPTLGEIHRAWPDASPAALALVARNVLKPLHHWSGQTEGEATPAQVGLLKTLGVDVKPGLSKERASALIDEAKGRRNHVKCDVAWCLEAFPPAQAVEARGMCDGRALCPRHVEAYEKLRCSECNELIDEKMREYSIARASTPLCFVHQKKHGVIGRINKPQ